MSGMASRTIAAMQDDRAGRRDLALAAVTIVGLSRLIEPPFVWFVAIFLLGAVIGFMTWIWLSTIIVLLGAEINAEAEQQTAGVAPRAPHHRSERESPPSIGISVPVM